MIVKFNQRSVSSPPLCSYDTIAHHASEDLVQVCTSLCSSFGANAEPYEVKFVPRHSLVCKLSK